MMITSKYSFKMPTASVRLSTIQEVFFFTYLCTITAHQLGTGFDAVAVRVAFVLYFGSSCLVLLERKKVIINGLFFWYLLFVIYAVFSIFWASSISDATSYTNQYIQNIAMIFFLSQRIQDLKSLKRHLWMIFLSLIYSVILLAVKTPLYVWGTERIGDSIGLYATDIGQRMAFGALIGIYLMEDLSKSKKILLSIVISLFCAVVMLSGSRKSIMLVAVGLFSYFIIREPLHWNALSVWRRFMQITVVLAIIAALFYAMVKIPIFYDVIGWRLESMVDTYLGTANDGSMNSRDSLREIAQELFSQAPLIGVGANNYRTHLRSIGYYMVSYCHDNFWELLCTLGILGFLIYYFMTLKIITSIWMSRKASKDRKVLCMLFIVLCLMTVLGRWHVYYYREFECILLTLGYLSIKTTGKATGNEKATIEAC